MIDWQDILEAMGCDWHLVGSRYTSSIVRPDSDWDYLVFIPDHEQTYCLTGALCSLGFEREGGLHYSFIGAGCWQSLRRGDINLIITGSEDFIEKHRTATSLCRFLDVTSKELRKDVFRQVFGEGYMQLAKWEDEFLPWKWPDYADGGDDAIPF